MRTSTVAASAILHGALILGLGLALSPWVFRDRPRQVPIAVLRQEPVPQIEAKLPDPVPVEVVPVDDAQVEEPELPDPIENEVEAKEAVLLEEPGPVPYPELKPIPELVHRVVPVVVKPTEPEQSKKPKPKPTEAELEPRVPQDYVQQLHLDPRNKPPRYPLLARRLGVEGEVVVAVTVTPEGKAGKVKLLRSAGTSAAHKQMNRAAIKALEKWFYPKILRGRKPVEMMIHVPVQFHLKDR